MQRKRNERQATNAEQNSGSGLLDRRLYRGLKTAFIAVVLLNSIFLLLALYTAYLPSERIVSHAKQAFETRALTDNDWPLYDSERGTNQYLDCTIIQLIVNDTTPLIDALAPVVVTNRGASCETLRHIMAHQVLLDKALSEGECREATSQSDCAFHYARYWHGPLPIAATMLSFFTLEQTRKILKSIVYASMLILALTAAKITTRELKIFAYSIAGVAALFWGVPYFGQSLGHAPGDAALILGLALFLLLRERVRHRNVLVPYCASYGAIIVYFEYFTGQLPTAAGFLFVAAYLVQVTSSEDEQLFSAWKFALTALLAFIVGAVLTIVLKQVLALLLTDVPVIAMFLYKLNHWSSTPVNTGTSDLAMWSDLKGRFLGTWGLIRFSPTLTFGNVRLAIGLAIATSIVWCVTILLVVLGRDAYSRQKSDLFAFGAGAAAIFVWSIILFPNHTSVHPEFMVRMIIVPIALGIAALLCLLLSKPSLRTNLRFSDPPAPDPNVP